MPMPLSEYWKRVDLVVVGAVLKTREDRDNKRGELYGRTYEEITVRVDEVLRGQDQETVSVRRHLPRAGMGVSGGDRYDGDFAVGRKYLLSLSRSEYWDDGGYLVAGRQGVAPVEGGVAHFSGGPVTVPHDGRVSLLEIRELK